jgi:energy-coupling factor transport system substrate-specific component
MTAAFAMWRNTRMIVLAAVCAAIYSASLIAFKTAIPLIPGFTEVRVGNIFPVPMGIMFGPAGAWGTAIGNLLGDLFGGTFGPGSIGGFVGNFLYGYLPYALWTTLAPLADGRAHWDPQGPRSWARYFVVAFVSSAACAVVISAPVDALGMVPYPVLTKIITLNNALASWIGVVLLTTVFGLVSQQLNLFWVDVMGEGERGRPAAGLVGAWLVTLASVVGFLGGLLPGLPAPTLGWICTAAILLGSFLL